MTTAEAFLRQAVALARENIRKGGRPFGAVIVRDREIVGRGWNRVTSTNDPTAHAEIIAITQAAAALDDWRLEDCTLYVTLEPCIMCSGAILQARIPVVVYGATDPKAGAAGSVVELLRHPRLNHRCEVAAGVRAEECSRLLADFFASRRGPAKTCRSRPPAAPDAEG